MVFIAIDQKTKKLISAEDIEYTKGIKRDVTYFCECCNDQLTYVNGYERKTNNGSTMVDSHFRHITDENNAKCGIQIIRSVVSKMNQMKICPI